MPSYDLNGKVALVTGAARGIGFETARQMHLRGASVAVLDLDADEAREAAERIGPRAIGIGADVTDQGAMMAAVAEVVEKFGGLDVAVANAGIAPANVRHGPRRSPARSGSASSRSTCSASGARCARRCRRSSSGAGQMVFVSSVYAFANGLRQQPLRRRQGRGRVARPGAAGRACAARRERHRRLLRLGRHQTGPGRLRPRTTADRVRELSPEFLLKRITPEEAGAGMVRGDRGARAARLRPQVVALRLGPARRASTRCSTGAWRATPKPGRWIGATSTREERVDGRQGEPSPHVYGCRGPGQDAQGHDS